MKLKILFPCDYFDNKHVDEAYKQEFEVATLLGLDCMLFDYYEFLKSGELKLSQSDFPIYFKVIYRGWMLNIHKYEMLRLKLSRLNLKLINGFESYRLCHHFDNSYKEIENYIYTPLTIKCPESNDFAVEKIKRTFKDYFLMKDNVKSVKGTHFPDKIPVDINTESLIELKNKFIDLRGDLYTGEILLKQFVELKKYDGCTNEWRVFYLNSTPITISRNSNQPNTTPKVPNDMVNNSALLKLNSSFYTVDFAEMSDGSWMVIETGDGQVSGLSPNQIIPEFYSKIQNEIEKI